MFSITKKFNWIAVIPFLSFFALIALIVLGEPSAIVIMIAGFFLALAILASVYHAEDIAHSIGEGLGALVLALSVTVIEVGLILSLMSVGGEGSSSIARDAIFSTVMIVCNGIVGICLLLGGMKYKEIGFQFRGANSLLIVLISLSIFCFVLPNYTSSIPGPYYSDGQLTFMSVFLVLLYVALVTTQTRTHKYYFETSQDIPKEAQEDEPEKVSWKVLAFSFLALIVGLTSVVGLAKFLSPSIEAGLSTLGAPREVTGLLIATIVLLPEAITAVFAARGNRLQTSLNLALGSGAASIALTIPIVSVYSIMKDQPLTLGIDAKNTVFLLLSFIIGSLSLGNGKATALQGLVHLIIMVAFFVLILMP